MFTRKEAVTIVAILLAIFVPVSVMLSRARAAAEKSTCSSKVFGLGFCASIFANSNAGGVYPRLSSNAGTLMFAHEQSDSDDSGADLNQFLTDSRYLICPSGPEHPSLEGGTYSDGSYWYFGYAFANQSELEAFGKAYQTEIAGGGDFGDDLTCAPGAGSAGRDQVLRLRREETASAYASPSDEKGANALSRIPVVIERVSRDGSGYHEPAGGYVYFMDDRPRYVEYGNWPYTPEAIAIYEMLDTLTGQPL